MRRLLLVMLTVWLVQNTALLAAGDGPPLEDGWFVDRGACPFEGCIYRTWSVEADTLLYDTPRGTRAVGSALAGGTLEALGGIVYVRPVPLEVRHPAELEAYDYEAQSPALLPLAPGQRIYLLTYEGEGIRRAWFEGRWLYLDAERFWSRPAAGGDPVFSSCETPSARCWWHISPAHRRPQSDWWARVRLSDGTTGWTNETHHFGNKDALG